VNNPSNKHQANAAVGEKRGIASEALSRRDLLGGSVAIGATVALGGDRAWAADGKKTFTILHTNDLHSNLIGMAPAWDYSPFTLKDDKTRGEFARLVTTPSISAARNPACIASPRP
jgi:2',3'-cyclic-nucleotide 2'-phosphodiesterase (5'-nucleotidase family)